MRPTILSRGKGRSSDVAGEAEAVRYDQEWALRVLHGLTTLAKHEQVHAAVQEKHEKTEHRLESVRSARRGKEGAGRSVQ